MIYRIHNSFGVHGPAWVREYDSIEEAGAAIATALGWPGFCVRAWSDGSRSAYATELECAADAHGAYWPRIEAIQDDVAADHPAPRCTRCARTMRRCLCLARAVGA